MKITLRRHIAQTILLSIPLCACLISCARTAGGMEKTEEYVISHRIIKQPVDHANPDGPKLSQHVDVLIPQGAQHDAPVFFNLGNETDLTNEDLLRFYTLHGKRDDIIYVQAEHRGYGQSLTETEDQSVPSYVRIEQVLNDTHAVIHEMQKEFPGPWMAAGWSYGGALVIEFAHRYPQDISVILSSSGTVDWPFLEYGYDRQIKKTLGEACYKRLANHLRRLEPKKPFDDVWLEREFLQATIQGVVQYPSLEKMQPYFKMLTFLPTGVFIRVMHWMDNRFGDGEAWRYARATGAIYIGPQEVAKGLHNWRVWRYQMCEEFGGFLASEDPDGLFTRTFDDYREECRLQFRQDPAYATAPEEWSQREMAGNLAVPMVYVTGGMDPWLSVSLEPDFKIREGQYFFVPDGRHCPERNDPELAQQVLHEMLKYVDEVP
jgi:pimeloyl-ACP methyl ester carboxylesterase